MDDDQGHDQRPPVLPTQTWRRQGPGSVLTEATQRFSLQQNPDRAPPMLSAGDSGKTELTVRLAVPRTGRGQTAPAAPSPQGFQGGGLQRTSSPCFPYGPPCACAERQGHGHRRLCHVHRELPVSLLLVCELRTGTASTPFGRTRSPPPLCGHGTAAPTWGFTLKEKLSGF